MKEGHLSNCHMLPNMLPNMNCNGTCPTLEAKPRSKLQAEDVPFVDSQGGFVLAHLHSLAENPELARAYSPCQETAPRHSSIMHVSRYLKMFKQLKSRDLTGSAYQRIHQISSLRHHRSILIAQIVVSENAQIVVSENNLVLLCCC